MKTSKTYIIYIYQFLVNQHVKIRAGARLSCHLLLRLLEKPSHEINSYVDYNSGELVLKSWDRSLLSTWHHTLGW